MDGSWNPWKMTAIGMALVVVTALVTAVVVANWSGRTTEPPAVGSASPSAQASAPPPPALLAPTSPPPAPHAPSAPAVPLQAAVEACNRYASRTGHGDKTVEVVKDGAIGGAIGAAVGAASGAIAGGGQGAGKGAGIGGLVGIGGGVLYGLNENKKNDERYRRAYAGCMRSRGYKG